MIVELQQEAEIHYLRSRIQFDEECFDPGMYRRNQAAKFQFASSYIEEKGFCPASLGFLMYSTFYNHHTLTIVGQLISEGVTAHIKENKNSKLNNVLKIVQIVAPTQYVGKQFIELFVGLLREDCTAALGLYRAKGTNGSLIPYVYTNPQPHDVLFHYLVYILH
uniref:Uncharacterized protein n=1 Tax=Physcomitrium patens TaxID=3218 RepID=A0A2K1JI96_PHYPA|nr:hypothetical protein PHYPA_018673 [Physcomitrium patens]PNR41273.1 hypothetical protein PHYPA_018676 [Physcomitrium patens]